MYLLQPIISELTEIAPSYYRLKLNTPEIATAAKPGQFIQIRAVSELCADPLLARPISIYRINREEGSITLLFKAVGRGTKLMATKRAGDAVTVWGPIGNGFEAPEKARNIALLAGGIGMPPLFCLQEQINSKTNPPQLTFFYGGKTGCDLLETKLWEKTPVRLKIATEDGSLGFKGFITDLFMREQHTTGFDYLIACGPAPMLAAVQNIAVQLSLPGQISLESYMACGVGACLGCVCQTIQGPRRVCVDGPVFPIDEVIL